MGFRVGKGAMWSSYEFIRSRHLGGEELEKFQEVIEGELIVFE